MKFLVQPLCGPLAPAGAPSVIQSFKQKSTPPISLWFLLLSPQPVRSCLYAPPRLS